MINDIRVSENFLLSEFQSPDTKEVKINSDLITKHQLLQCQHYCQLEMQ